MKSKLIWIALLATALGCLGDDSDPGLPEWTPTWQAELKDERTVFEPGEWLGFELTLTDAPPQDMRLWLDNGSNVTVIDFQVQDYGDDADTTLDDTVIISHIQPYLTPGPHVVVVGTEDGPRSNAIEFEVVIPTPLYSREDVAQTIWWGMDGMMSGIGNYISNEDFTTAFHGEEGRNNLVENFKAVKDLAQVAGETYLEIPESQEPAVQAMLVNTGLLEMLSDASVGVSTVNGGIGTTTQSVSAFELAFGQRPVHAALYELDITAVGISIALKTADAVALAMIASGGGALGGVAIEVLKLGLAAVAIVIEVAIPTDLQDMEIQGQDTFVDGVATPYFVWGHFAPQKPMLDGVNWGLTQIITRISKVALKKIAPVDISGAEKVAQKALEKVLGALSKYGVTLAFNTLVPQSALTAKFFQAKVLLDMRMYDLTLADLAGRIHFIRHTFAKITPDHKFWTSIKTDTTTLADWAKTTTATTGNDTITLQGTTWPALDSATPMSLHLEAYSWRTTALEFLEGINWIIDQTENTGGFIIHPGDAIAAVGKNVAILILGPNNPLTLADGWFSEAKRDIRRSVINGLMVRPAMEFREKQDAGILLKKLETRAGDWAYIGHQHRAEFEWHAVPGIRHPATSGGGFDLGYVFDWSPPSRLVDIDVSLANANAAPVTLTISHGPDTSSLVNAFTSVPFTPRAIHRITLSLAPGENIIRFHGNVANDTAVVLDVVDIFDTDQQPKHVRIDTGTHFDYKLYTPPAL